ncbi:MAG: restriction endonuclease [Atopobiaceae bacterium]|nr:restriction endonuclease [Atopobiaceae bacterium]
MAIPTQSEAFRIALGAMADGAQRSPKQIKAVVRPTLGMTSEEEAEVTSSGKMVWDSRISWAVQYLQRAGLLERVSRGVYCITELGHKIYADGTDGSEMMHLLNAIIAKNNPWNTGNYSKGGSGTTVAVNPTPSQADAKSPDERIDEAAAELDESLSDELLQMIMDKEPAFFEKLVVDLIERMGYGRGRVTQYSGDGGIDGMVTTDELGFRPIYTQAKRYKADSKVGRQMVQAFFGALGSIHDGVFITTSSFTKEAIVAAEYYPHATVVLIDGKRLTQLMIKYELGVTVERVVKVKRVDLDYFEG